MRKYILIGFVFIGLLIISFSPPVVNGFGSCERDADCLDQCPYGCSGNASCHPTKYKCDNNTCRCDCAGCDRSNTGTCGYGSWYDCLPTGCKCREIYEWTAGTPATCEGHGLYESSCGGGGGGTVVSCGDLPWPACSGGLCGSGTNCIATQNAPCRCSAPKSCSDVMSQALDPIVERISPTEVRVRWKMPNPASNIIRMSLTVDALFGNDPPVVNETTIDPRVLGWWLATGLTPGKYYLVSTTFYNEGASGWQGLCRSGASTRHLSSCRMTPDPLNISAVGQTGMLNSEVVDDVGRVGFFITNGADHSIATVSDTGNPDIFYPFANRIMAVNPGTTSISNNVQLWVGGSTQAWVTYCNDKAVVNVGILPTPTPTPVSWIKLKDTSFVSQNNLTSLIPLIPASYDADDDGTTNLIIGSGGVVGAPSVNVTGTNASAKTSSPNEYKVTGYSPSILMTPSSFLTYIKARKQHKVITSLGQITADGIYIWDGTYPLPINDTNKVRFDNYKVVLIGTSDVSINTNTGLDPVNGSLAIIAPTITFTNSVEEANGIFIANNISTGSPSDQGLKIIGNLVALESLTNDRQWTNSNKPSLFVVFDQQKYIDLLPYLSTANYDWRQIQ